MKAKLKSYEFWVSIVSAIMVVLQSMSLKFDLPYIQEIVMAFLGALAVAGIVKKSDGEPPEDSQPDGTDSDEIALKEESKQKDKEVHQR